VNSNSIVAIIPKAKLVKSDAATCDPASSPHFRSLNCPFRCEAVRRNRTGGSLSAPKIQARCCGTATWARALRQFRCPMILRIPSLLVTPIPPRTARHAARGLRHDMESWRRDRQSWRTGTSRHCMETRGRWVNDRARSFERNGHSDHLAHFGFGAPIEEFTRQWFQLPSIRKQPCWSATPS
jgi:hypothetical protein